MIITFPNIRANFIPDPGYTLFDVDLEGADAQVVAWDAGDEDLKAAFRARLKVHAKNAKDIYGEALAGLDGKREPLYTRTKRAVHATHYGATPRALATKCKMTLPEARHFQTRWLDELHPAIRDWMHGIDFSLQTTGGVKNAFGYGVNFYQRGSDAFTEALAWRPQSTVARVCEIAMVRLYKHVPECQILLQAHDSINFQIKTEAVPYSTASSCLTPTR